MACALSNNMILITLADLYKIFEQVCMSVCEMLYQVGHVDPYTPVVVL